MDVKTIAARTVEGAFFNVIASIITAVSGLVRSILLARWLLPEYFGTLALAMFFLTLATQIQYLAMPKAFIHRQDDSPASLGGFATLRLLLTGIAVLLCLVAAPGLARIYADQPAFTSVFAILALFEIVRAFNSIAETALTKDLHFRRLAVLDVLSSLAMTILAPAAALAGAGIWALVIERLTGTLVRTAGLWLYRRPWKPIFLLPRALVRWYLRFGFHVLANANLTFLLDQFDDFWTGTFLGATALGYYSRAYEFARYPRRVLARPIVQVFFPAFARLQEDRGRLSKAFFRACSFIVRLGFLIFGTFALVAPEFVRLFLGRQWMPMILTFQLMLFYMLLDPLVSVLYNLLTAVGRPQMVTQVQMVRLAVFVPAVVALGTVWGINGVAAAANLTLGLGLALLFWKARGFVDFSVRKMFGVPAIALGCAGLAVLAIPHWWAWPGDLWGLIIKGSMAALIYSGISLSFERSEYRELWQQGRQLASPGFSVPR